MGNNEGTADIVVIGGGIIGVCAAFYLSSHPSASKSKITILEGTSIAAAASGRAGGLLAKWAYPDCLAGLSFDLHEQLAEKLNGKGRWGYRRVTCGQIDADTRGHESKKSRTKSSKKYPWPDNLDWLNPETVSIYGEVESEDATAQVHPKLFTQELAEEASKNGVEIVLGRATRINTKASNDSVESVEYIPQGSSNTTQILPATTVILAAGPWSKTLMPSLPLKTVRAHSLVIATPQVVSPYALFTSIQTKQGQFTPEIYARPDSTIYTCGETDSLIKLPLNASDVQVDARRCDELFEQIAGVSEVMANGEITTKQACYLPNVSGGGGPIVGPTKTKGLFIATGHTCWGIQNSAATGKLLSEMIFDGQATSSDISELHPSNWNL